MGVTEVLCLVREKEGRHMYVCYNEQYLGKIFGPAPNAYDNIILPGKSAGGHFHKNINELYRANTPEEESLTIILADPKTGKRKYLDLGSKRRIWDGGEYVSLFIIPAGIAHMVQNNTDQAITLSVITSGQHEDDDVYPCEF